MVKEIRNYGTRRVFPVADSSLAVIIPAEIVKEKGLEAKQPVRFISDGGGEITIRIEKKE
ncbi:MAG: AbrB/MazE/SpoVT family DNA-binding domain-containing protein [Bacteroidales bacterium]|nr:AbrB/MazE/SpoVT family DNA-binding domain-containing protein [Bacteroidales bacterium]